VNIPLYQFGTLVSSDAADMVSGKCYLNAVAFVIDLAGSLGRFVVLPLVSSQPDKQRSVSLRGAGYDVSKVPTTRAQNCNGRASESRNLSRNAWYQAEVQTSAKPIYTP
jgi:hypothetical protein